MSAQNSVADALVAAVDAAAARLRPLSEAEVSASPSPDDWSVKQIVGHLIDSAANNHQRFVRAQAGPVVLPGYDQNAWVDAQGYQEHVWPDLLEFWVRYNHQLSRVIRRIPAAALGTECRIGADDPVTLGFLVEDYLSHLEHHLRQVDSRLGR